MLDFNQSHHQHENRHRRRARIARRQSWRVWTLLLALGLVVLAMRQLQQPETAERLGQLFGSAQQTETPESGETTEFESFTDSSQTSSFGTSSAGGKSSEIPKPSDTKTADNAAPLSQIRDNTYFRPDESDAWFGMFGKFAESNTSEPNPTSVGELTYAQLLKQPNYYRGKLVTVRGTVRREEFQQAPENQQGIETYHRLWIEPVGGGKWPIVVYSLTLPREFPRGDKLSASVTVDGYFFKNWSYPWSEGLGIAPVVLSQSVQWNRPKVMVTAVAPSNRSWLQAMVIAAALAALVVYVALRNTRRPKRVTASDVNVQLPDSDTPVESVHEQLQRFAETEPKR